MAEGLYADIMSPYNQVDAEANSQGWHCMGEVSGPHAVSAKRWWYDCNRDTRENHRWHEGSTPSLGSK